LTGAALAVLGVGRVSLAGGSVLAGVTSGVGAARMRGFFFSSAIE